MPPLQLPAQSQSNQVLVELPHRTLPLPPTTEEVATKAEEDTTKEVATKAEGDDVNPPLANGSANSREPPSSSSSPLLQWQEQSNSTVLQMVKVNNVTIGVSNLIRSRDSTTGMPVIHVDSTWTIRVISARARRNGTRTISPVKTTKCMKEWGGRCAAKGSIRRNCPRYEGAAQ